MNKLSTLIIAAGALMFAAITANSQTGVERKIPMTNTKLTKISKADEAHSFEEYKAIEKALQPYIDSAKSGSGELTKTAFHEHAHIVGSVDGTYYDLDLESFGGAVDAAGPAPEVQSHIAWINVSGPAAAARVEFIHWGENRFTDFFVLYKKDGEWKISGKVYDSHTNN